ncbi:hypothetical protein HNP68_000117 [Borrelia yangtzensis]|uniref:Uncharacterized protein n=1 Tax=Borreliella yangtzensis TaxID=683292 RepID=A0ABR6P8T8_9SPIR|nr:hypothetical protein [Borreliella yangtzensis]
MIQTVAIEVNATKNPLLLSLFSFKSFIVNDPLHFFFNFFF